MTDDDDSLMQVYNRALMALSAQTETPRHLKKPDVSAKAVSPICGSEVRVELALHDNKVVDFGYEVEACALTRTVVAIMKTAILGKTREEIAQAGAALRTMLEGGTEPAGDWADLKILAPVREYKARHNSILLPFEAVEKALK
ncbi:MAG: iron-sulfur cluster assembly scaffold protein [Alphaproteobacteria bacterium]|nr:iron-sulfur cluster assembly scaffold protein [Alphaproteobacteria bacterium]